ncbi:MAG: hypothetical protein IKT07_01150 [Oscillospiraceae bacterium]|nr:hypothetical protein [Oscillospiraceae bacterium]
MEEELFEIIADEITVEVTDKFTGKVYRRELPIDYYENANLLKLSGENMDGSVSQLVFYSSRGLERLKDLTGLGADHDPCGGHSGH